MPYQTKLRESRFCESNGGDGENDPRANLAAFRRQASYGILGTPESPAMKLLALAAVCATCTAHSNLIYPKPRNAIDSQLPEWQGGKSPCKSCRFCAFAA